MFINTLDENNMDETRKSSKLWMKIPLHGWKSQNSKFKKPQKFQIIIIIMWQVRINAKHVH
jgi:hypothetical protein